MFISLYFVYDDKVKMVKIFRDTRHSQSYSLDFVDDVLVHTFKTRGFALKNGLYI